MPDDTRQSNARRPSPPFRRTTCIQPRSVVVGMSRLASADWRPCPQPPPTPANRPGAARQEGSGGAAHARPFNKRRNVKVPVAARLRTEGDGARWLKPRAPDWTSLRLLTADNDKTPRRQHRSAAEASPQPSSAARRTRHTTTMPTPESSVGSRIFPRRPVLLQHAQVPRSGALPVPAHRKTDGEPLARI